MKHFKSLLSKHYTKNYGRLIIVVLISMIIGASIINIRYHIISHLMNTPKPTVSTASSQNNNGPALCVVGDAGCNQPQASISPTTSQTPAPQNSSTAQAPAQGANCTQVESWYGPAYTSAINGDYKGWSSAGLTTAEINYEGNKLTQQAYALYKQSMTSFNCSPQLSLTFKYPATAPNYSTATATPVTPITPTCNTTQETEYKADYTAQYNTDQQQEQQQINNFEVQLGVEGAGNSSAASMGINSIESQFNLTIQELQTNTNYQLSSINCPPMSF
jgi:hypothetical protein